MYVIRKMTIQTDDFKIGDQIIIPLGYLGIFTATAQVIEKDKILFLFDDYIAKRPMNENGSNEGGYEKSDLKKWIDTELFELFPDDIRNNISGLTIPTVGEIGCIDEEWDEMHIESDTDTQLPLMEFEKNTIAYYHNNATWGWLRNATIDECSSECFASINRNGYIDYMEAFYQNGVRPEFWLYY